MGYEQILLFFFMCWLSYLIYWLLLRGPPRDPTLRVEPLKPTIETRNLTARKHWAKGERVKVFDDGTYATNIYRTASNTFGESADRHCIAFLVPESERDNFKQAVSVVVDGLRVGYLSARDVVPFNVMLQGAGLNSEVTSCDAHIGGGGTGLDGKKRRYSISLYIDWFEA